MAHLDQPTRWWVGDHHGERDPDHPRDLWCDGCRAWTEQHVWHLHAWHAPATGRRPRDPRPRKLRTRYGNHQGVGSARVSSAIRPPIMTRLETTAATG